MKTVNLAARFLLEVLALVSLAYWGWQAGPTVVSQGVLAVVAPALFATVWGLFIAPKAPRRLQDPSRMLLELVVFALAALALIAAGSALLAPILAAAVLANLALMVAWGQRGL